MASLVEVFRPKEKGTLSDLQQLRLEYKPALPPVFRASSFQVLAGADTSSLDPADSAAVKRLFPLTYGQPIVQLVTDDAPKSSVAVFSVPQKSTPLKVGVVFCGRPAPGGHNVLSGLYDALKARNPESQLLGFVEGTTGFFSRSAIPITDELLSLFRNQGGFDLMGRTRDSIKTVENVEAAKECCKTLELDGIVLIGGPGTATDAASLAETFKREGLKTSVISVPVTIDGDLKNQFVETTVGFDTVTKVNSQLIANICTDALSAEKYYYFVRLMGRKASHLTLECALQSQSNLVILGEDVSFSKLTLLDITNKICDAIALRSSAKGKHHGVILFPEGLIEHIPEVNALLEEINVLVRHGAAPSSIPSRLSPWASALFNFLPPFIRNEFLNFRETQGSIRLSQIETEKLILQLVETEMDNRTKSGAYKGKKFNGISYFFGYQSRGSLPSNFDCDYAYSLGATACSLISAGLNGYETTVNNLKLSVDKWSCGGVPITAMMNVASWEKHPLGVILSDTGKPAVNPVSVDFRSPAYCKLQQNAQTWLLDDLYSNPGPLQFEGASADSRSVTLSLEDHGYLNTINALHEHLDKVKSMVKPGCPPEALNAALSSLQAISQILSIMTGPSFRSSA